MESVVSGIKFKEGEWVAFDNGHYFDVHVVNESGGYLSQVCMGVAYEEKGHAHLIASARKMYEMLESVSSELYMLIDEVNDQRASRITPQTESEPDYHDMQTLHEIQLLLKEARGE